jgi:hypothetical protein
VCRTGELRHLQIAGEHSNFLGGCGRPAVANGRQVHGAVRRPQRRQRTRLPGRRGDASSKKHILIHLCATDSEGISVQGIGVVDLHPKESNRAAAHCRRVLRLQHTRGLLGRRRTLGVDARFRVAWAETDARRTHCATGKNDQCKCAIMPIS